jgi:hypothetical protein
LFSFAQKYSLHPAISKIVGIFYFKVTKNQINTYQFTLNLSFVMF